MARAWSSVDFRRLFLLLAEMQVLLSLRRWCFSQTLEFYGFTRGFQDEAGMVPHSLNVPPKPWLPPAQPPASSAR